MSFLCSFDNFTNKNKISKAITQSFIEKEIRWNEEDTDITFDDGFELVL